MNHNWTKYALLAAFPVIAYWPMLSSGFVWDDFTYVIQNETVRAVDGLTRIWRGETVDFWPLSYSLFWLQFRLWGENPLGYHVTNLTLHVANGILLYALLRELKLNWAWATALAFAVHPVGAGTVAWMFQTKTTLAALFGLLSALFYVRFARLGSPAAWFASLLLFAASLLAKTSLVFMPLILLLLDTDRPIKRRALRLLPFFLAALTIGYTAASWYPDGPLKSAVAQPGWRKISTAILLVWFYFSKAVAPISLNFVYSDWRNSLSLWHGLTALGAAISCVFFAWRFHGRHSVARLSRAALVYVLLLFPALGFFDIFFLRYAPAADPWHYPAFASVLAAVIPTAAGALASVPRLRAGLFGTLVVMGMVLTNDQARKFRDEETLWRDTLAKNPRSILAHNNLGVWLDKHGRTEEAKEHYLATLALDGDDVDANVNMGAYFINRSNIERGIPHLYRALKGNPDSIQALLNLGLAKSKLGEFNEAVRIFEHVLRVDPRSMPAHNGLGNALADLGRHEHAFEVYKRALNLDSSNGEIHFNLGVALEHLNRPEEAKDHFQAAFRLIPNNPSVRAKMNSLPKQ